MTRMAMVFTDAKEPEDPIIFANASFLSLTGYERAEVLGKSFNFLMGRGADPEAMAQIEAAFDGSSKTDPDIRYRRKDGSHFYATVFISPVRMRTVPSCSISYRSPMSPNTTSNRPAAICSSMSSIIA